MKLHRLSLLRVVRAHPNLRIRPSTPPISARGASKGSRRCTPGSSSTRTGRTRTRPGRSPWSSVARLGSSSTPPSSAPPRASCSCSSPRPSTPAWPRSRKAGPTRSCTSSRDLARVGRTRRRARRARLAGWCSATVRCAAALERAHDALAAEPAGGLAVEEAVLRRGRGAASPSAARPAEPRPATHAEHAAVRRARRTCPERWDQRVTLAELATLAGLSRFELVRRFREQNGVTPHAFQTNLRVDAARRLARGRPTARRGGRRLRVRRSAAPDPRVQARRRREPGGSRAYALTAADRKNVQDTPRDRDIVVMGVGQFDTKVAVVVRDDLATWQRLNVTAFLISRRDRAGRRRRRSARTTRTPTAGATCRFWSSRCWCSRPAPRKLTTLRERAERRGVTIAIYTREMFATGNDEDNRAAVRTVPTGELDLVGIAVARPPPRRRCGPTRSDRTRLRPSALALATELRRHRPTARPSPTPSRNRSGSTRSRSAPSTPHSTGRSTPTCASSAVATPGCGRRSTPSNWTPVARWCCSRRRDAAPARADVTAASCSRR